jgi:hypothetical protein
MEGINVANGQWYIIGNCNSLLIKLYHLSDHIAVLPEVGAQISLVRNIVHPAPATSHIFCDHKLVVIITVCDCRRAPR